MEYVRISAVNQTVALVLASNSPRRRELLTLTGWKFTVRPTDVDESQLFGEPPEVYVQRLSESKAEACTLSSHPEEVVVAADTAVTIDGVLLGKPGGESEAVEMLRRLRGRRHQVFTGIVVRTRDSMIMDLCITDVPMRSYTDEELLAYVASGDPLDKAGAYAIQHPDFHPVEGLQGCYASVMGLPLCHLVRSLRKVDLDSPGDVPSRCQAFLQYRCPVSDAVLRGDKVG